jgi:hypothetical protein
MLTLSTTTLQTFNGIPGMTMMLRVGLIALPLVLQVLAWLGGVKVRGENHKVVVVGDRAQVDQGAAPAIRARVGVRGEP